MPLADRFVTPDEFGDEFLYDLDVVFCPECSMVQLAHTIPRALQFHEGYPYFSSGSERMRRHFEAFARRLLDEELQDRAGLVVEIGCNDGVMAHVLAAAGAPHIGVEPSDQVAAVAAQRGVRVLVEFFDEAVAERIRADAGAAAVVYAANVLSHIADLHGALQGIELLLRDDGTLVFEEPYLGDVVAATAFDQFYDEHVFYFSVGSVQRMLELHGLELVDVEAIPVHGGSLRYTGARPGRRPVAGTVSAALREEARNGLADGTSLDELQGRVDRKRDSLLDLLRRLARERQRVVGYGATAKSCTVINYCGITTELVEFVCDSTPSKQGKFTPGAHLPVRAPETFADPYPDYSLLFAWNHADEVAERERDFSAAGGRWIVYVPEVGILPDRPWA
jgi:methylation protein EvaC